jgi:hypothetical protein
VLRVAFGGEIEHLGSTGRLDNSRLNCLGADLLVCGPAVSAVNELVVLIDLDGREHARVLSVFLNRLRTLFDPGI